MRRVEIWLNRSDNIKSNNCDYRLENVTEVHYLDNGVSIRSANNTVNFFPYRNFLRMGIIND